MAWSLSKGVGSLYPREQTHIYLCKGFRLAKCPIMKIFIALLITVQYREEMRTLKRQV